MKLKDVEPLARKICNDYNYPMPSKLSFNRRLKDCLGRCNCITKEIQLNEWVVLHNPKKIIEALLKHEICHLRHCTHSKEFKIAVTIMGSAMSVQDIYPDLKLNYKYTYQCPSCGKRSYHDKKVDRSCGECYPKKYNRKFKLKLVK